MSDRKPTVQLIVAYNRGGYIGKDGDLLYRIKEDLQHFKKVTMNTVMIMGRKTFESLPGVLPGRHHVVVTKNADYRFALSKEVYFAQTVEEAMLKAEEIIRLEKCKNIISVIGGERIFNEMMPFCDVVYRTCVNDHKVGDARIDQSYLMENFTPGLSLASGTYKGLNYVITKARRKPKFLEDDDGCEFVEEEKPDESTIGDRESCFYIMDGLFVINGRRVVANRIDAYWACAGRPSVEYNIGAGKYTERFASSETRDEVIRRMDKFLAPTFA